ncbi:MAG: leucine-rich repeat protein [Oribacterium sp.]|nr:leucine-rich repeat protein [Oribacterium sp.]
MKKRNAKVFALFMSVAMAMPNVAAAMPVYAAPEFEDEADFGDKFEEEFEAEAEEEVEAEDTADAEEFVEETEDIEDVQAKVDEDTTPIVAQGKFSYTQWELRESGVLYLTSDQDDYNMASAKNADGKYPWDAKKDSIKEVYVNGPLKVISEDAFKGCKNLELVTLNKNVVEILDSAFEDCANLTRVTYPSSDRAMVQIYGANAFRNCTALEYLTFTKELTEIREFCFYNCKSLKFANGLNLQGKIDEIERGAFWGCTSLTKLILPANVKAVDGGYMTKADDADKGYDSADACSDAVDVEGKWGAFAGCTGLTSVEFRPNKNSNGVVEGIEYIGEFAFYGCTGLGALEIPATVTDATYAAFAKSDYHYGVDSYAFENCTGLAKVTMQDANVEALRGAFKRCYSLGSFTVVPTYDEATKTYSSHLYRLEKESFQSCTSLKEVDLAPTAEHGPVGIDYIFGDSSFRDCTSLASIKLPTDTLRLEDRAFQGCTALTTIDIPEGTTTLGKNVFFNDIKLDDIYLPSTLTAVGQNSFSCTNDAIETMRLMDVYYGGGPANWSDDPQVAYDTIGGKWICNFPGWAGVNPIGNTLLTDVGKNAKYKANKFINANIDLEIPQIKEVAYENGGMKISWNKVTTTVNDEVVSPSYYHIYQNHDKDNTISEQWNMQTPLWEEVAVVSGSEDEFTYNIEDVMKAGDVYSYRVQAVYEDINLIGGPDCTKLGDAVSYTIPVKDSDIIPVKGISFADSDITVKKDESQKIDLVIDPVDATNVNYVWNTEDEKIAVATVSDDKKSVTITGKSEGHTMVTVTTPDGKLEASFIVYVVDPKTILVDEITVDKSEVTAEVGSTEKVSISIKPEEATGKFEWTTENPTVATVKPADDEKSAQITAVGEGETKITVNSNGVKATITVKVVAKKEIPESKTPIVVEDSNGKTSVYQNGKAVENYTGLAKLGTKDDAPWVYVENGKRNQEYSGFVDYDGASFWVSGGTMDPKSEGLKLDTTTDTWYYVGAGMVQNYTGLATYNGEWFYVENGKLNTTLNAFVEYDGGLFAVGAGRIISEYNGLMQDPQNTKTGDWYFFSKGQAQKQYTGLAQYDGAWFYIQSGKFDPTYTGSVVYDGATFNVVNGQAVIQ